MGVRKIGRVGKTGEPLLLAGVRGDEDWIADPEWMKREGVKTVAAQPLIFHGEVLGVLAIFDTGVLADDEFQWLRIFADSCGREPSPTLGLLRKSKSSAPGWKKKMATFARSSLIYSMKLPSPTFTRDWTPVSSGRTARQ